MQLRKLTVALLCTLAFVSTAAAAESKIERSLKLLMPADRMAQLCDYTVMTRIRNDQHQYRPERAVANATTDININGDTIEAKGGAFRSRGKWYAMSYVCKTDSEHLNVLSFSYKVGAEIPQEKWAAFGLWQ